MHESTTATGHDTTIVEIADGNQIRYWCDTLGCTEAQLRESVDPTVRQFIDGAPDGPFRFHYPAQATLAADFGLGERA